MKTRIPFRSAIMLVLLLVGIVTTALSVSIFTRLDQFIHNDLYRYGLQFNLEWAGQYWTYARLILSFLGLAVAMTAGSIALILTGTHQSTDPLETQHFLRTRALPQSNSTKIISLLLFSAGMIALAFSINYTSSILAFIGLGLVFWGAILFYIRPERHIPEVLLDKTILPTLESVDQILRELDYNGKGIYLPPKYLKDFESSKVYISRQENTNLPPPEKTQIQEDRMLLKNLGGILITPPGMELTRLFEETLGTSFTGVDLKYLERNMPRLLIEELEIAQNLKIETRNSKVIFKIENSVYKNMCKETRKLSKIFCSLGCPLCSAIACALAKATNKPIVIEKEQESEDGKTVDIEYRLLEEPPQ